MVHLGTGWKRLKQVDLDGVMYDICLSQRDGMFQAAWVCRDCCEQGTWAPISRTPSQADELAQISMRIHHLLVHGAKQ